MEGSSISRDRVRPRKIVDETIREDLNFIDMDYDRVQ